MKLSREDLDRLAAAAYESGSDSGRTSFAEQGKACKAFYRKIARAVAEAYEGELLDAARAVLKVRSPADGLLPYKRLRELAGRA